MIATNVLTQNDARAELEAAVEDGTLPPESLRRLGLDNGAATQPFTDIENTGDATPRRNEDQTQVRLFASPVGGADVPPMFAQPSPVDTDSVWVEPNSLAANKSAGVGTLLGNRYRLEHKLGEGGMGAVYRVTDLDVKGETFAIKVLKPAIRDRPEALKVMREEVRKTRALRHPNIVAVYSLNSDPTGVYMLMEYLEGKSVGALIDEDFGRGMPLMRAWPLIHDIGSALAFAHDRNVIHSDLKPSNLFVTISGQAMLLDFGIARAVRTRADQFDTGTLGALTPAYASTEMLLGNAPDQSDDVYAFACVIYEMLCGRHPFNGLGAIAAHKAGLRPAPLTTLTARQNQALAKALAFVRADRTCTVEALMVGLESTPQRPQWFPPWSPVWLGAAGVAVCLVAGVATWMTLRKPAPEHARTVSLPAAPVIPRAGSTAVPTPAPVVATTVAPTPLTATPAAPPIPMAATPMALPASSAGSAPKAGPAATAALTTTAAAAPAPASARASAAPADAASPTPASAAQSAAHSDGVPQGGPRARVPIKSQQAGATTPVSATGPAPVAAVVDLGGPGGPTTAEESVAPTEIPTDAGAAATAAPSAPASPVAASPSGRQAADGPPIGKKIPGIIPLADSNAKLSSCPYPEEARRQVETGTVVLLVHVSPDGSVANTQVETSSGSASLDQGAADCIKENARFAPKLTGKSGAGYWGRIKYVWSVGD